MSSVDVIVPCYNYGRFLEECVQSVLTQSIKNVRVLVIDDESSDNTAEVARLLMARDPRVHYLRHQANIGHIATYNEGLKWASADYTLLLSADDFLLPDALERSVVLMDAHPEVGFTYGRALELQPGDSLIFPADPGVPLKWEIVTGMKFIEMSGAFNIVPTATAVVRTRLQHQLGGYRHDLPHAGDMEMWLRFATHSSVGIIHAEQAVYRRHSQNMSLSYNGMKPDIEQRRAALEIFLENNAKHSKDASRLRQKLMRALAESCIPFASLAFNKGDSESCTNIIELALDLSPEIRTTSAWRRLMLKRRLGKKNWWRMRPFFLMARRLFEF